MRVWLSHHRAAVFSAFRRLLLTPLNTALSLLVIGIAMTLPAAGYVLLENFRTLGSSASGAQQISIFMAVDAGRKETAEIEVRLKEAAVGAWHFVPREAALKRLQASEGMGDIVASLPRNPLPDAFVVEPQALAPEQLEALRERFAAWPGVVHVQLDSGWVRRLDAFLRLGKLAVLMLAGLFAAGLVAVTFNTIRLQILSQAAEIEVARLIGATNGFIRRPFYYFGALQGALGGLFAALLVMLAVRVLAVPVAELGALYGGQFSLQGPGVSLVLLLVTTGAILGWLGAQLSVSISLRRFD